MNKLSRSPVLHTFALAVILAAIAEPTVAKPTITYRHLIPGTPFPPTAWSASTIAGGGGESEARLPDTTDLNDPKDGEFVFALAKSSILLPAPDKPGNSCPQAPQADVVWKRCLSVTAPKAAPHSDIDYIYAVRVAHGLSIQPTFSDDDPLLLKSVAANYKSPTATNLTRIGEEAALGMALYGPSGAGAAVLIGEIVHAASAKGEFSARLNPKLRAKLGISPNLQSQRKLVSRKYICPDSTDHVKNAALPERTLLLLPVTLEHTETGSVCWHEFPKGDEAYSNQGWFYRVIEENQADATIPITPPTYNAANAQSHGTRLLPNGLPTDDPVARADGELSFFKDSQGHISATGDLPFDLDAPYLPISACHAVIVQIAWWTDIVDGMNKDLPNKQSNNPTEYHLSVADPRIIQKIQLDKTPRTITMLACGARVTAGLASNEGDDVFNAFTKEYQNVRAQQKSWEKNHK